MVYGSVWSKAYIDAHPIPEASKSLLPWLIKDRREAEEGGLNLVVRDPIALDDVVPSPQWLHIAVMKAFALFGWIGQIKRRTGDNVIDMPTNLTVVAPCHTRLPKGFKIGLELIQCASQHDQCGGSLHSTFDHITYTNTKAFSQSILDIFTIPLLFIRSLFRQNESGSATDSTTSIHNLSLFRVISGMLPSGGTSLGSLCRYSLFGKYSLSVRFVPFVSRNLATSPTKGFAGWGKIARFLCFTLSTMLMSFGRAVSFSGHMVPRHTPETRSISVRDIQGLICPFDKVIAATQGRVE